MDDQRILELLRRNRQGLTLQHIFKELRVPRKERAKIEARILDLENAKIVRRVKNRYLLPIPSDLVRGRFEASARGFGFVVPSAGARQDIFIPARFAKGAMQEDIVEVLYTERGRRGKPEGLVVRILKKERKSIIGLYEERLGAPYLIPLDAPSLKEIPLVSRGSFFPAAGMIIAADRSRLTVTDVFGMPDEPGVDTHVMIRKYGLSVNFSQEAIADAEAAAVRSCLPGKDGRVDYRSWTTFTIDGENAQDFDDAVSIKKLEDGSYLLGVHIADVSHYVDQGSALDAEAFSRATSVYFPDLTLPMLPERLSNDVCSLRPGVDRLTVSALLEIGADGIVRGAEFHPSVIRTAGRLTYTGVFRIFAGDEAERQKHGALVEDLLTMRNLARILRRARVQEGSLDFDLLEPELVYKDGRLHSVATFVQNEAHKLIEEFMVAANVAVASFLGGRGIPLIYRVHPQPAVSDLEKLKETLVPFGIVLPKPEKIGSRDLQRAILTAEGKPEEKFVNVQVLRAMKLAVYSAQNLGHFGLAKKEYTHFTSPIRRYPDLVVHRILKETLRGHRTALPALEPMALHASGQERNADNAERDLIEWRIFRFLKEKLGEELTGILVDFTKEGLVIELDDYFVRGILAYEDLGVYHFPKKPWGEYSRKLPGQEFALGQRLRVILVAVSPVLRRMRFVLPNVSERR